MSPYINISISYYYKDDDKIDFKNKNLISRARITSISALKSLLIPNHLFLYSKYNDEVLTK
jgi:hypothetical protein|tara:strand:- start:1577 stop:1759 length:183 start_codon:yes stop_codon:yes gene_type:complete